jgi:hypothetical protein
VNYRVIWELPARTSLQQLYDAARDQEGLVQTVTRIDLELSANPAEAGESREVGTRILFKYPLIVWFQINERMKEVMVFQVRAAR